MTALALDVAGFIIIAGLVIFGGLYAIHYYRIANKRLTKEEADLDKELK